MFICWCLCCISHFEDEISLRKGECENPVLCSGTFWSFYQINEGQIGLFRPLKKKKRPIRTDIKSVPHWPISFHVQTHILLFISFLSPITPATILHFCRRLFRPRLAKAPSQPALFLPWLFSLLHLLMCHLSLTRTFSLFLHGCLFRSELVAAQRRTRACLGCSEGAKMA